MISEDVKKIYEAILDAEKYLEANKDFSFSGYIMPLIVAHFRDLVPIIEDSIDEKGKIDADLLKNGLDKLFFSNSLAEAEIYFFSLNHFLEYKQTQNYLKNIILIVKYRKRYKELSKYYNSIFKTNNYEEIIQVSNEIISIIERVLGPDHPNLAIILNNLANLYYKLGDYQKAEPLYKRALEIKEKKSRQ